MARTVLFLCTGNYYRSRYAEELFNHLARRAGLDWEARSHALAIERGKDNVGPMARQIIDALTVDGISPVGASRMPAVCTHDALEASDMVVAVKEAEHRALLTERFPGWEDRVTYWHVHDIDVAPPDVVLGELKAHVARLVCVLAEPPHVNLIAPAMWQLVERYVGRVGYKGGVKSEGLSRDPPVIDCSGWAALLLSSAMQAMNDASESNAFNAEEIAAIPTWSDRMIEVIETRTGFILEGDRINLESLPRFATIGLRQGGGAWAANHPRPRGITHVVQVVRRPDDGAPFVTESQGWATPYGIRLLPLADWLDISRAWLKSGEAWAVDPFAPGVHRAGAASY
jgi:protein-tyrosine-phosphatase